MGKKVLPEATWILANVLDPPATLGKFDRSPTRRSVVSARQERRRATTTSIYYGTIHGNERGVAFISAHELACVHPLDLRTDLHRYSDGFRWGDDDPRTLQLALALLSFALESDHRAMALYRSFAAEVLMFLACEFEWSFTQSFVLQWAEKAEASLGIVWMKGADAYLEELHT